MIEPPIIISHRGASGDAPENTLAAFREAHRQQVRWIELDVQNCGSEELVVFHDDTLERTTNGNGSLLTTPYPLLATLDAGSWFNKQFAKEKIPTLTEALTLAAECGLNVNIEIKNHEKNAISLTETVLQLIQQQFPQLKSHLLISSFSLAALETARACDNTIAIGVLIEANGVENVINDLPRLRQYCRVLQANSLHIDERSLNKASVSLLKQLGCLLFAYTVNDKLRWQQLQAWGVDGVFTDFPRKLL